jgi:1-aminocyclopropane-1-carboxylate deaminase/D-cysteine desulfhydrase-like pyridoxal-dependent ACC family enzyme
MIQLERLPLTVTPSPLHRLDRLGAAWDVGELWIKRDDLLGRVLGGNKLRKLEYILPLARSAGADALVTTGSFESNHCCLTASVAHMLGLEAGLILMGPRGPRVPTANERIVRRLGTEILTVEYDEDDPASRADLARRVEVRLAELTESMEKRGRRVFLVPPGGSSLEGSYAFFRAFGELHEQMKQHGREAYSIVLAVGTGSTFAGLWCGAAGLAADVRVCGVSIARTNPRCIDESLKAVERLCRFLNLSVPDAEALDIRDGFVGDGYSKPTPESVPAIQMARETEGLLLDHTYTGKALGALRHFWSGRSEGHPIVFWHTGGVSGAMDDIFALRVSADG